MQIMDLQSRRLLSPTQSGVFLIHKEVYSAWEKAEAVLVSWELKSYTFRKEEDDK